MVFGLGQGVSASGSEEVVPFFAREFDRIGLGHAADAFWVTAPDDGDHFGGMF